MKESSKFAYYASRLLFAGCFLYLCNLGYQIAFVNSNNFEKNFAEFTIVNGQFDKIQRSGIGRTIRSTFTYTFEGERYFKKFDKTIPCRDSDLDNMQMRNEILSLNFPVAISNLDPNLAISLIKETDFNELNLEFPDSLRYTYDKYFNCTWWEQLRSDD